MTKHFNEIISSTFTISLLTGVLYISGESYVNGFLNELSLDSTLYAPQFTEVLSSGFYMLFIGGIHLIIPLSIISLLFYLYSFLIGEISKFQFIRKFCSFFIKPLRNSELPLEKPRLVSQILNLSITIIVFVTCVICIWVTIYRTINFTSDQGKKQAKQTIEKIENEKANTIISINGENKIGSIIKCSSTHCAIFFKESNYIQTVPVKDIETIATIFTK